MIKHPKEKPRVYPTVEETYAAAGLGALSVPEKSEQNWIAVRSHRSHFRDRTNRSSYSPKTNTPGLLDGSAEVRAILGPTFEGDITQEGADIRRHALRYLKGMNSKELSFAAEFFNEPTPAA